MGTEDSGSFDLLHPRVQEWIWQRRWTGLRDAQERAIPLVLEGKRDLIICAATAAGKTEAAFLPIASHLVEMQGEGLAVYVSPLKALINDQFRRMEDLFGACDLPVYPWHGDVGASRKSGFERNPRGLLLITPESLESWFVRNGIYLGSTFRLLKFVVVDELHSFINTERGFQLASLLCRLENGLGRRVPRIGLSATLGDMRLAAQFLRPGEASNTEIVESRASGQEVRLLIKGYEDPLSSPEVRDDADASSDTGLAAVAMARDMFKVLRGSKNLAFANSRRRVEEFTDLLVRLCESESRPVEFFTHHGSLSKELREDVESILKEPDRPATAFCTSTLEMGIDIGQVKSVAQLDPPFSVASLRQRLGRSGRRGDPAVMRMFVTEPELHNELAPQDRLRLDLFQSVAVTNLLLNKWCESPRPGRMHLSTLIQQILSLVAQYGGITAKEAWKISCKTGPFRNVNPSMFAQLLRGLAEHDILMQSEDGTLLHGPTGERIVNHYSFYTAFWASEEFKVIHGSRYLGSLPISHPIPKQSLILFGGRRWRVIEVDDKAKMLEVVPAHGGRAPIFSGGKGRVDRRVHEEMYSLYQRSEVPPFLDARATTLFHQGRQQFAHYCLSETNIIPCEEGSLLFLWAGDLVANTLLVQVRNLGITGLSFGVGLFVEGVEPEDLRNRLSELPETDPDDAVALADSVPNRIIDRYDCYLPDELLSMNYASGELDVLQSHQVLATVCGAAVGKTQVASDLRSQRAR